MVDHSNDNEVEALFEKVKNENNGRLDVLVNNAYAGVDMIFSSLKVPNTVGGTLKIKVPD